MFLADMLSFNKEKARSLALLLPIPITEDRTGRQEKRRGFSYLKQYFSKSYGDDDKIEWECKGGAVQVQQVIYLTNSN